MSVINTGISNTTALDMGVLHTNAPIRKSPAVWRLVGCVLLAGAFALAGCTTVTPAGRDTLAVTVEFAVPDRSRFSGKGAGAGMMLSSTLGAAGVAVGIAIDEGIGKDLQAVADDGGIGIKPLLMAALRQQVRLSDRDLRPVAAGAELLIRVERYGFILQPGRDDPTAAQLSLRVSRPGSATREPLYLQYPTDFQSPDAAPLPTLPLARLKTNPADIEYLWRRALERVFADSRFSAVLR